MSIALAIKQLYPNATDDQFRVEDHKDGRGAFVAYWGVTDPDGASLPEPSIESLRVVEAELLATPLPEPTWQEKRQANVAGGGYGEVTEQLEIIGEQGITAFQNHIAAVKAAIPKP